LQDDEALLIEADYPKVCEYASLILTNSIFETTDWVNNHSSLNGAQWHVTADGKLWIVVSAKDPGIQNWLDTAGYPLGVVQGRWTECDSTPLPNARVVKLADVTKLVPADLPKITAQQRERIVRDRRAHYQQRVHW
jgi:predicted type IV restriction endonuclease